MAQEYASKQPKGFKNHIENVAIVGVSYIRLAMNEIKQNYT